MKIKNIKMHQAVEMAFMLYPPMGMKFKTAASPRSTWVKPIVNGEDTYKYLSKFALNKKVLFVF